MYIETLIDRKLNNTERFLSKGAAIPFVGTPFGIAKVLVGTAQLITGLILGILSLPLQCSKHYTFNNYCWKHVKHGFGNVFIGLCEAIPFVGLGIHLVRKKRAVSKLPTGELAEYCSIRRTHHEDKFMPYPSLVRKDTIRLNISKNIMQWSTANPLDDAWYPIDQLPKLSKY